MPRIERREINLETSNFTPEQLQTRFLLEQGMAGWAGWSRANLLPFRDLIGKRGVGLVITGVSIDWTAPFRFFDAETIEVTTSITLRPGGELLDDDLRFLANGVEVVKIHALVRPIRITDASLSAQPAPFPTDLIERFQPDEITAPPHRPRPAARAEQIRSEGDRLAGGSHPFRVRRAETEVADQWSFIDVPSYAAAGREDLLLSSDVPEELQGALGLPLASIDFEITRPLFVFDEAKVVSDAYAFNREIVFVHTIESTIGGGRTNATLIETLKNHTTMNA
ncbi:MAG TPA: hypothetical protein VGQ38_09145 [Gaiellaceae bacterium]|jgi:hypothetical protein|nr:hypothetical protein [Gaiellaceae bacterium]